MAENHIERASRLISDAMSEIIKAQAQARGNDEYPESWVIATDQVWSKLYDARTKLIDSDSRAAVYE